MNAFDRFTASQLACYGFSHPNYDQPFVIAALDPYYLGNCRLKSFITSNYNNKLRANGITDAKDGFEAFKDGTIPFSYKDIVKYADNYIDEEKKIGQHLLVLNVNYLYFRCTKQR